jgi:hypothetical protein
MLIDKKKSKQGTHGSGCVAAGVPQSSALSKLMLNR